MAGEYIEFHNNAQPALNETNVNRMQQLIKQDIQGAVAGDTLPVGVIIPFCSDTIPQNWLLCDGSAVSRTDYEQLFNTIGITFGQGDGFTTFNLPDLRDRVPVGKDSNDENFNILGKTYGEKTHTMTVEELVEHSHEQRVTAGGGGTATRNDYDTDSNGQQYSQGVNTGETGGGQPFNIVQPSLVTNYIIKASQSSGVVATVVDNLISSSATDALSANQGRILNEKISESGYIGSDEMTARTIGGVSARKYDLTFEKEYTTPPTVIVTYHNNDLDTFGMVQVGVSNITITGCRLIFGASANSPLIGVDYLVIK